MSIWKALTTSSGERLNREAEECKVEANEAVVIETGLGSFIIGYDCRGKRKGFWEYCFYIIFNIIVIVGALYLLYTSDELRKDWLFLLIVVSIFLLGMWWLLDFKYPIYRKLPKGVYVYENGIIWLKEDKETRELKQDIRICFDDVESIKSSAQQNYYNGNYQFTSYKMEVIDKQHNVMYSLKGIYDNEDEIANEGDWAYAMFHAVMTQWAKVAFDREMAQYGYISFISEGRFIIGEGYIQDDKVRINQDDMVYELDNNNIKINQASKKRGLFSGNDFNIDYLDMEDGQLLLYSLERLLDIKR